MFSLVFTKAYTHRALRFLRNHPELRASYQKTLQLLELNPFHPSLRLHKLKGRLSELHSVSINLSYRMTIEFLIEGRTIIPVAIGSQAFL